MSTKILFLDTDFLSRAWQIGGEQYLLQVLKAARESGFVVQMTDVVRTELSRKPENAVIARYLESAGIKTIDTVEGVRYAEFMEKLTSGELPPNTRYVADGPLGLDGGDASILERMRAERTAGNQVVVASDDGFFRGMPSKGGQSIKGFNFDPSATSITTAQFVNVLKKIGNLTPLQLENVGKLDIFDPQRPTYSKVLAQQLMTGEEVVRVMKDGGDAVTRLLPKLGAGLKFLGTAGLIFDIGISSAEAAQAAQAGDAFKATEIMSRLAARTYGGILAGVAAGAAMGVIVAGTPLAVAGVLVAGVAGTVLGSVAGDSLVESIFDAARKAIDAIDPGAASRSVGYYTTQQQQLLARNVPSDISRRMAAALNDGSLGNDDSAAARQARVDGIVATIDANDAVPPVGEIAVRYIEQPYSTLIGRTTIGDGDVTTGTDYVGRVNYVRQDDPEGGYIEKYVDSWDSNNVEQTYSYRHFSPEGRLVESSHFSPTGRIDLFYVLGTGKVGREEHFDAQGALIPEAVWQAQRAFEEKKRMEELAARQIAAQAALEAWRREQAALEQASHGSGGSSQPGSGGGSGNTGSPGAGINVDPFGTPSPPAVVQPTPEEPPIFEFSPIQVPYIDNLDTATRAALAWAEEQARLNNEWAAYQDMLNMIDHLNSSRGGGIPVALDLNGDGNFAVRTFTDMHPEGMVDSGSPGIYDMDDDGVRDRSAWLGPQDGFLVIDIDENGAANADGVINQTKELSFAKWRTAQEWQAQLDIVSPGSMATDLTDLQALLLLFDSNHNGALDQSDQYWNLFRVWQDANQNGLVDSGELRTLNQESISSVGLIPAAKDTAFYADGSAISGTSSAQLGNGAEMLVGDLRLRYDPSAGTTANALKGGSGNDSYVIDNPRDTIVELPGGGVDMVAALISVDMSTLGGGQIEHAMLIGSTNLTLVGNALDNQLIGNTGNNTLTGGAGNDMLDGAEGADTMYGGTGDDRYVVDNVGDVVIELASQGNDQVDSYLAAYTLGANIENGRILATGAANMTGNSLANTLYAGSGNNVINGDAGTDTLSYAYAVAGVTVNLALTTAQNTGGSGTDTVRNIERLTGSSYKDTLTGNSGDNILDGGSGADTMAGGAGNDTYVVDDIGDVVIEAVSSGNDQVNSYLAEYTLGNDIEYGRIMSTGAANMKGNTLANIIYAGDGDNVIDGGSGTDTASYSFAKSGVTVNLSLTTVQNTGESGMDQLISIERVNGSLFNDTLTGTNAANILNGQSGNDRMVGLGGNDVYYVQDAGDVVVEAAGQGTDIVYSYLSAYTLTANVENLRLMATGAANGTGNELDNIIYASAGNNVLTGGTGSDTAHYQFATAGVTVSLAVTTTQNTGGSGTDTLNGFENLSGSDYNDILTGDSGANVINGGKGADTLAGDRGNDTLMGASGNDRYLLNRGDGSDTIVENDATVGNTDVALFGAGVTAEQLWFRQAGNALEVSIIGTSDKITVKDWYLGNSYHVEQFRTSAGDVLLDSSVQNLVVAMAAFSPPAAGQTAMPQAYQTALAPVIAANWQ